jgi:hypothetical protein
MRSCTTNNVAMPAFCNYFRNQASIGTSFRVTGYSSWSSSNNMNITLATYTIPCDNRISAVQISTQSPRHWRSQVTDRACATQLIYDFQLIFTEANFAQRLTNRFGIAKWNYTSGLNRRLSGIQLNHIPPNNRECKLGKQTSLTSAIRCS